MSDHIVTRLGRETATAETRERAARYLTRSGNADLLDVLGLVGDEPVRRGGNCEHCGNKLPGHGVCRRGRKCREAAEGQVAA